MTSKHRDFLLENPELLHTPEGEVRRELDRLGIENEPYPDDCKCPKCGTELEESSGFVGESMLLCPNEKCEEFCVWADIEGAIRAVY